MMIDSAGAGARSATELRALYPLLLGADWNSIDAGLRSFHGGSGTRVAAGKFNVRRGSNWLARLTGRMLRLPASGLDVPSRLTIRSEQTANASRGLMEVWEREFGGERLTSLQWIDWNGMLVERFGRVELSMVLRAERGALCFSATGASIVLGRLSLRLPGWLAPRVAGRAAGAPSERDGFSVSVKLSHPMLGLLFLYEGEVAPVGGNP